MEYECSPLSWEFYNHDEGLLEDLKHSLLYTTLELEATIVSAKEEITKKECELINANDLLSKVIKERDEAREKCQKLMLEKQELQIENKSGSENEHNSAPNYASSDCEENSSTTLPTQFQAVLELAEKKPLPEKGKFLKAVVEAGPLLQTLLLAGPLPQWQHPPPQLKAIEIPPVSISSPNSSSLSKKRDFLLSSVGSDCSVSKCRKVVQHLPTTPTHFLPHPSFS
ncbi:uncharacterized protein LOC123909935 [Trifolium pratense]|uniref:Uncharacterized protein n=1 Tax=Trifolium pratense TaxID=57577 RepID=A0ACB0IB71_TRIPR|nr:uncharacterized protein LOC123909935 [Trifolium pratense]CAJ2629351.1 unnamed protein product [Trifolium pratense]